MINLRAEQVPAVMRQHEERARKAIRVAAVGAAHRFKARLVARTDELGITDTGIFKNAWRVATGIGNALAEVYNDAPYAGILELGARPHKVSAEAREAIKRWAMRKLQLEEAEAEHAAWAIAKKIEAEGVKPHYIVRDLLRTAQRYLREEMKRAMDASRPTGAPP